jgi:hypothetical protein
MSRTTSSGIRFKNAKEESKLPPCFTARPYISYRKKGFHFTEEEFERNTFNLDDIFHEETVQEFRNNSIYDVKEVKSFVFGKCFSICYLKPLKLRETIYIKFLIKSDVEFSVYTRGQEFWLSLVGFPPDVSTVKLNSINDEGINCF